MPSKVFKLRLYPKIPCKSIQNADFLNKYSIYKCQVCGKWHIGKNKNRILTEEDREKIKKQIQTEKFYKNTKSWGV